MSFEDKFREKYRVALHAARKNDKEATIEGLKALYRLFSEQYSLDNEDSIVVKAKLSYWQGIFGEYIVIVQTNGLQDRRIQKFFGLIGDTMPSFGDGLENKDEAALPKEDRILDPVGDVNIAGITEPEYTGNKDGKEELGKIEKQVPIEEIIPEIPVKPEPLPQTEQEIGSGKNKSIFEPDTLEDFIGQQHIVKTLLKEIAIAKKEGRKYLDNILLFGNPGLGKTTLMELIAKALGVEFEWMDCSQYRNSKQSLKALQNFLMKVAKENKPVVIAFDEIHMLTDELQSSLLTLLNNRVYVSPPDVNGVVKRIPIDNFTFIAATTDDDKVLNTIKDRCLRLKFQMVDYTPEELKRIYKNKFESIGLTITDEAIETCIPRSRGSIRYVNSFVAGLKNALYNDEIQLVSKNIDLDVAKKFFEEKGIDELGLEKKDLEILYAIDEDSHGAIGVGTLSARIGLDPKKYLSEYEPYLIKIGFITVTGKGRCLTEKAIKYLKEKINDQKGDKI